MGVQKLDVSGPVLTQQNAKDECDINIIVEKAKRGADLSQLERRPIYGDFTNLPDYRTALIMVNQARDAFMALDANVRKRFGNDPAMMLDFLNDPNNREEAVKLGLVNPEVLESDNPPVEDIEPVKREARAPVKDSFEAPPPAPPLGDRRQRPR